MIWQRLEWLYLLYFYCAYTDMVGYLIDWDTFCSDFNHFSLHMCKNGGNSTFCPIFALIFALLFSMMLVLLKRIEIVILNVFCCIHHSRISQCFSVAGQPQKFAISHEGFWPQWMGPTPVSPANGISIDVAVFLQSLQTWATDRPCFSLIPHLQLATLLARGMLPCGFWTRCYLCM